MREMALGRAEAAQESSKSAKRAGKYVAVDCEMVGVGDGTESSLARVSVVDYHGAVLLDVFVKQRERVVDWRTYVSGVREEDMKHAMPFEEVQQKVSDLLKGRILVGHAVHNDTKALLLSHPYNQTRDTQAYCGKLRLAGTRPSLRNLVKLHFGIDIQKGEHSSVIDARATMAIYRVHSKAWEQLAKGHTPTATPVPVVASVVSTPLPSTVAPSSASTPSSVGRKRKRPDADAPPRDGIVLHIASPSDDTEVQPTPKRQKTESGSTLTPTPKKPKTKTKTRISSGLSTVVRGVAAKAVDKRAVAGGRKGGGGGGAGAGAGKWWETLGGSKGSMTL
ncbi:ribonuclease H-like protein [Exidia glandulosa HHB12029]|uniref:RNA exonuclease 4 n=1 Tax=Exidia glandulosa HHB12029 TaxID=1314781 RepID=A0A165MK10_EXIGL|nr:ribonuclease H-like protein [Exidia glandulosa HHB12029]